MSQLTVNNVKAFVEAMAFEPSSKHDNVYKYIDCEPTEDVSIYCKDFVPSSKNVRKDCTLLCCPGTSNGRSHAFMEEEGYNMCSTCKRQFCHLCLKKDQKHCVMCMSENVDCDPIARMTEADLRAVLEKHIEVPLNSTISTLQEMHSIYIDTNYMFEKKLSDILYPVHTSDSIHNNTFKTHLSFDLKDGGCFIKHQDITTRVKFHITHMLANLITFDKNYKDLPKAATALPAMIVKFAQGMRVDNGERMMTRCIRHSMDPKCPPITSAAIKIISCDNTYGLSINGKIPPSFKEGLYDVTTIFTTEKLLATSCDCKSGSICESNKGADDYINEYGKHGCVHCLPLIYKLTILLMDGLAEHYLIELASCFDDTDMVTMTDNDTTTMADDIKTLMAVAGYTSLSDTMNSPMELLQHYKVNTDKMKSWNNRPRADEIESLGPIRNFKQEGLITKAKIMIKKEECRPETTSPRYISPRKTATLQVENTADYVLTWCLAQTICKIFDLDDTLEKEGSCVGHQILKLRMKQKKYSDQTISMIMLGMDENLITARELAVKRKPKYSKNKGKKRKNLMSMFDEMEDKDDSPTKKQKNLEKKKEETFNRKIPRRRCEMVGCYKSLDNQNGKQAPQIPPDVPILHSKQKGQPLKQINYRTHQKKIELRQIFLDRMGITKSHPKYYNKDLRICKDHPMENKTVTLKYTYYDTELKRKITVNNDKGVITVPIPAGRKTNDIYSTYYNKNKSKGLGNERRLCRVLRGCKHMTLALQQMSEISDGGRTTAKRTINPVVLETAGLNVHNDSPIDSKEGIHDKNTTGVTVTPWNTSDNEVKWRTGFKSMKDLLIFISVVCNGDADVMTKTTNHMTWFEEWFLYFEVMYKKTNRRWLDLKNVYDLNQNILQQLFYNKLKMVMECMNTWPRFLTHVEDMILRKDKWKERYENKRVMMWDNTDVPFEGKPSMSRLQRLTYSQYYGGNVAKGGVFLQLSGWLGGYELWLGAISDTEYFEKSGLLQEQEIFQSWDNQTQDVTFTNILDKGYRSILTAWRTGGQLLLQPFFAKSDAKFASKEVLFSAAVASDRSGNERAVQVMKRGAMGETIHHLQRLDCAADMWLAWGFQANFMYNVVL